MGSSLYRLLGIEMGQGYERAESRTLFRDLGSRGLGFGESVEYLSPMTETEKTLLQVLVQLERTVREMPAAQPKPNLLPLFERLDELTAQLPKNTDPNLVHYLHKKSYEKARLWLEGREAENQVGHCRHTA
jgi:hypothetical protein